MQQNPLRMCRSDSTTTDGTGRTFVILPSSFSEKGRVKVAVALREANAGDNK